MEDIFIARQGSPLIYANRAYGTSRPIEPLATAGAKVDSTALRVGCFRTFAPYVIPELVARVVAEHPATTLRLRDGSQRQVLEGLNTGDTEVALVYDFGLGPELNTELLGEIEPHVLLPRSHPLAAKSRISLESLRGESLILLDSPPSRDYFLSIFDYLRVEPNIDYRADTFETVRGLVGRGLGYSLLATKPASSMTYDGHGLATVRLDRDVPSSRIVMAMKKGSHVSSVVETFSRHCRDFFHADPQYR